MTCAVLLTVPGKPLNVNGYSPNSNSITVFWDHPLPQDRNGVIVNYTVLSQKDTEMNMTSTNSNDTMLTLTDLDVFTNYTITVIAHTRVGPGEVSNMIKRPTQNSSEFLTYCNDS